MRLPDQLIQRPFTEWNYIVRGVVEAWEVARILGKEQEFEEQLAADHDGRLIETLGEAGNVSAQTALHLGRLEQSRAPGRLLECLRLEG